MLCTRIRYKYRFSASAKRKIVQHTRSSRQSVLFLLMSRARARNVAIDDDGWYPIMPLTYRRDNGIFATNGYRRTHYVRGQHLFPTYANLINGYTRTRVWCVRVTYMYTMSSNGVFMTIQGPLEARCRTFKISIFNNFILRNQLNLKSKKKCVHFTY